MGLFFMPYKIDKLKMWDFPKLFEEFKHACSSINHNRESIAKQDGSKILKMSSTKPHEG